MDEYQIIGTLVAAIASMTTAFIWLMKWVRSSQSKLQQIQESENKTQAARIDEISKTLLATQKAQEALQTAYDALKVEFDELNGKYEELSAKHGKVEQENGKLRADIGSKDTAIMALQSKLEGWQEAAKILRLTIDKKEEKPEEA